MANVVSNHNKFETANGYYGTGTFRGILMATTFVFNEDTHANLSDLSASELAAGFGYTTAGNILAGVAIAEDDVNNRANVTWNNTSWVASGGSIGPSPGMVIYKDSGVAGTSAIVGFIDFGVDKTEVSGQTFEVSNLAIQLS